jgi:hypothetical protein
MKCGRHLDGAEKRRKVKYNCGRTGGKLCVDGWLEKHSFMDVMTMLDSRKAMLACLTYPFTLFCSHPLARNSAE